MYRSSRCFRCESPETILRNSFKFVIPCEAANVLVPLTPLFVLGAPARSQVRTNRRQITRSNRETVWNAHCVAHLNAVHISSSAPTCWSSTHLLTACLSREPMRRLQKATHAVIHLTNTRVVINQSCVTGEGSMSSPRAAHISHSHHFYQTGYTMPRSYLALSQQIPLLSRALMLGPSLPNTELIRLVIIRHLPSQLFLREGVEDMWKLRDEKQLTSSTHITRLGWMISLAASLLSFWRLPLEFAISTHSSFTAVAKNF